jgi:hypothetical protein
MIRGDSRCWLLDGGCAIGCGLMRHTLIGLCSGKDSKRFVLWWMYAFPRGGETVCLNCGAHSSRGGSIVAHSDRGS